MGGYNGNKDNYALEAFASLRRAVFAECCVARLRRMLTLHVLSHVPQKEGSMYKKILVAYDRSSGSRAGLEAAIEMLDCGMAEQVIILSVMDSHDNDPTFEIAARIAGLIDDPVPLEDTAPLVELEQSLVDLIKDHDSQCKTLVMRGKTAEGIANTARDYDCDLIVMGRRGVGALQAVMGSVSTAVLRNSELPILVAK